MTDRPSTQLIGRQVWIVVRFMLFGVVGFFVMITFSTCFLFGYYQPDIVISAFFSGICYEPMCQTFVVSLPLTVAGALMMLYGVGEWKRWRYLIAFFSIPVSYCLFFLVPDMYEYSGKGVIPLCISVVTALTVNSLVHIYCCWKQRRESQVPTNTSRNVLVLVRSVNITYPIIAGLICGLIGLVISFTGYAWVVFTYRDCVYALLAIMPAPLLYVRRTTGYGLYCVFLVIQYGLGAIF